MHKRGLTDSEETFFTRGAARGWLPIGSVLATSVLCRETLDGDALLPELSVVPDDARPRVIFWPSYISDADAGLCQAYRDGAAALARGLGATVLQSNWPESLNEPGVRGFGAGVVIAPDGRLVQTLPRDEAALAVVDLA
ncbi:hypothetical protein ACS5PN_20375 [Roseateles sp. NT4]|uniref:hypothetical protein n=1 Tax=Roseateles sp. NT4 TaxID=3453715 RepID=UPI003EEF873F